jgi:transcriptional regulator with XRE-family HTH domain
VLKVALMLDFARSIGMEMDRDQCRAARALLRWSQPRLAKEAGVATMTVVNFELGTRRNVTYEKRLAVRHALEKSGIMFGDDGSVKLRGINRRQP